jgi:hypothetical protein
MQKRGAFAGDRRPPRSARARPIVSRRRWQVSVAARISLGRSAAQQAGVQRNSVAQTPTAPAPSALKRAYRGAPRRDKPRAGTTTIQKLRRRNHPAGERSKRLSDWRPPVGVSHSAGPRRIESGTAPAAPRRPKGAWASGQREHEAEQREAQKRGAAQREAQERGAERATRQDAERERATRRRRQSRREEPAEMSRHRYRRSATHSREVSPASVRFGIRESRAVESFRDMRN